MGLQAPERRGPRIEAQLQCDFPPHLLAGGGRCGAVSSWRAPPGEPRSPSLSQPPSLQLITQPELGSAPYPGPLSGRPPAPAMTLRTYTEATRHLSIILFSFYDVAPSLNRCMCAVFQVSCYPLQPMTLLYKYEGRPFRSTLLSTKTNCSSRDLPRSETHIQHIHISLLISSTSLWQRTDNRLYEPSGRKVSRLAAMESWLRRWSQQSCRGTRHSRLWSAVRFCRDKQRCRRCGRDISWFMDTSRVSRSCRSPISGDIRQTQEGKTELTFTNLISTFNKIN